MSRGQHELKITFLGAVEAELGHNHLQRALDAGHAALQGLVQMSSK